MVEVENIQVGEHDFIGIYLNLPQYPIHFIMSTHSILTQDNFSLHHFERLDKDVAVIMCRYTFGFDGLLASVVVGCNAIADQKGVTSGMKAKEALMLCEKDSHKEISSI